MNRYRSINLLILLCLMGSALFHLDHFPENSNIAFSDINSKTFLSQWETNLINSESNTNQNDSLLLEQSGTNNYTIGMEEENNKTISWDQAEGSIFAVSNSKTFLS